MPTSGIFICIRARRLQDFFWLKTIQNNPDYNNESFPRSFSLPGML
jgi:hypothetical protein